MRGKNKCRILKQIRQRIADENDIPFVTSECTYRGECRGTCPKCEAELRYLEQQLSLRRQLGKAVAVTAITAGLSLAASGCVPKSGGGASDTDPGTTLPQLMTEADTDMTETEGEIPVYFLDPDIAEGILTESRPELMGDVAFIEPGQTGPAESGQTEPVEPNVPETVLPTETITPVPATEPPAVPASTAPSEGQTPSSAGDVATVPETISSSGNAG